MKTVNIKLVVKINFVYFSFCKSIVNSPSIYFSSIQDRLSENLKLFCCVLVFTFFFLFQINDQLDINHSR